jgi:hypothetical protein
MSRRGFYSKAYVGRMKPRRLKTAYPDLVLVQDN